MAISTIPSGKNSHASSRLQAIRTQHDENAFWLVLSEFHDESATWLCQGLEAITKQPVMRITSCELENATRAERGVDDAGVWFSMTTRDGRTVHSRRLRGVVYLLDRPVLQGLAGTARAAPRRFAGPSTGTVTPLIRWLHSWEGPILNRPEPNGPTGERLPRAWWVDQALAAGFVGPVEGSAIPRLPTGQAVEIRKEPVYEVIVIGDVVLSAKGSGIVVPKSLQWRCVRVARAISASMMGIEATRTETGTWRFSLATLRPDLRNCGEAAIRAIARALGRRVGEGRPAGEHLATV